MKMSEQGVIWLQNVRRRIRRRGKHIPSVIRVAATSSVATALVLLGAIAAWRISAEQQSGRIELTNEGRPLSVQVLAETGRLPIGEPIDLVTRTTLNLPDGDYQLRVNGVGRMGRTYRFAVNRGEKLEHAALD